MATDDLGSLDDERTTELSSIEAIFPELAVLSLSQETCKASIDIEVNLDSPLSVVFTPRKRNGAEVSWPDPLESAHRVVTTDRTAVKSASEEHPAVAAQLMHLPSLRCNICLPTSYPAVSPPQINLYCDTPWLPITHLRELESQATVLWEEGGKYVVLFDYLDWLGQAARAAFGLARSQGPVLLDRDAETPLLDFDLAAKKLKFEKQTFNCGVCLEPKKGVVCHKMAYCGHVFCKTCLQNFYNNCIVEGDVANVKCMNPGCEKERLQEVPEKKRSKTDLTLRAGELVEMQVETHVIQRYVKMKRKKELEANKNTVYCPRKWCQGAARQPDKDEESEQSETEPDEEQANGTEEKGLQLGDRLAICSDCSFAFCSRCMNGWHGEHVVCRPPRTEKELSEEEKATEAYLAEHSTRCPTCGSPVQKTMGCNHMLCQLCRTHFCYLCSAYLLEANPYAHYNTPGQGCYQKLWVLEGGDFDGAPAAIQVDVGMEEHIEDVALDHAAPAAHPQPMERMRQLILDGEDIDPVFFADSDSSSEEDEVAPPPRAPSPPHARGRGRGQGRGARGANRGRWAGQDHRRGGGGGADHGRGGYRGGHDRGRGGQQQPAAGQARPPLPADEQNALRRFLELARNDMEDEWDSDELDLDDEGPFGAD